MQHFSCFNRRFIHRFALAFTGIFITLLWANQVLHLQNTWPSSGYQSASCLTTTQNNVSNRSSSNNDDVFKINQTCKIAIAKPPAIHWSRGRLDNRRMLRIYEWIWTGEQWDDLKKRLDVCLATQSSVDRLVSIAEVSEKWLGPISLAVYIRIPDEWIALNLFVMYMQRCSAPFAQTVSIHVAVPTNYEPSNNDDSRIANFPLWSTHPCGQPLEFLGIVMEKIVTTQIDPSLPYPQNHMRNVARKTCGTPWVFMSDVDIIPRPNSAQMLQEFYDSPASNCSRCQFVIPAYEMSPAAKYPESKKELIEYESKDIARQFWLIPHANSHFSSNQSLWAHTNLEEGPIKISHNVSSIKGNYEPFYIGPDNIPAHDERFLGFGYTRPSQVLEALETGWTFKVLTPIFVIHRGFKGLHKEAQSDQIANSKKLWTDHEEWPITRAKQHAINARLFNDFAAELKAKKEIALRRSENNKLRRQRKQVN